MHTNFYENDQDARFIQVALNNTGVLVKTLDDIRSAPPRPFTIKDDEDRKRLGDLLGLRGSNRPAIGATDPGGFARKPEEVGDQGTATPAEPAPPDRPSPPAKRQIIPDHVSIPATDPPPRGDQRASERKQGRNRTPDHLKPKSGHSSKGTTPSKRSSTNAPAEIKRFVRRAKRR